MNEQLMFKYKFPTILQQDFFFLTNNFFKWSIMFILKTV